MAPFKWLSRFRKLKKVKKDFSEILSSVDFVSDGTELRPSAATVGKITALVGAATVSLIKLSRRKETPIEVIPSTYVPDIEVATSDYSTMVGTSFDAYAPKLSGFEGGYSNIKEDKGGATYRGVTLRTYRTFFGVDSTVTDLKQMTDAQWRIIMKSYWDKARADEMINQSVAEIFVDWLINSGFAPIKIVQSIVGAVPDGRVGDNTLDAINNADQHWLFNKIKQARREWYLDIVRRDPTQRKFLKGWLKRLDSFVFTEQSYPVQQKEQLMTASFETTQSLTRNKQ